MVDPRELLRKHGLSPKKSFGQSFLVDANIVRKIADACRPDGATVIEIGAGTGVLTAALAPRAKKLVAIERDRDLAELLRAELPDVEIVEDDAQTVPLDPFLPGVLCGNLPYQITGQLIRRAVEHADRIERAVFMVQLEVAERLVARPGTKDYGALTVFTGAAFSVKKLFDVGRHAFHPPPNVTSAVVELLPRKDRVAETETFRRLVKGAFEMRRKTLRNAWRAVAPKDALERAAKGAGISLDARGETLSVDDFAKMSEGLKS